MIPTIAIVGSEGRVFAPFGMPGSFMKGKHEKVRVITLDPDEKTPLVIREALVGMKIPVIFESKDLGEGFADMPPGTRLAYADDVIEVLEQAGKNEAAVLLREISPHALDMYVFEPGTYELLES